MGKDWCLSLLIVLAVFSIVCGSFLRNSDELTGNCFDNHFGRDSCIFCTYGETPHILIEPGEPAVDFTLHDVSGKGYTLSHLLKKKPVVLLWGMYTCPAYQGLADYLKEEKFRESSYEHEYSMVDDYHNLVTFVHLYGPEPHPMTPFSNFDTGVPRPQYWSIVPQAQSYSERVEMAQKIKGDLHPQTIILPDYLPENGYGGETNEVWCTLGLGARTSMLIGTDGLVKYTQDWFHKTELQEAIDMHLKGSL